MIKLEIGSLFTLEEFKKMIENGSLNEYDGHGVFFDGLYRIDDISVFDLDNPKIKNSWVVIWYNR